MLSMSGSSANEESYRRSESSRTSQRAGWSLLIDARINSMPSSASGRGILGHSGCKTVSDTPR